jgi:glycolate oxidase FAD binding subunit
VRTRRLARVVEYAPSDQIAIVEAGLTLSALQQTFAAHGQRLALDPPLPGRATIGGVVAANSYGPRRHRFGASRDLVVGMSFVRADGVLAKGGGKVVKNVAGFDVPRLLVGSLGTLALIATVTVRLHPLPEREATVLVPRLQPGDVRALVSAMVEAQLEPSSVVASVDGDRLQLGVRFEGFGPGVAQQTERWVAKVAARKHEPERLDEAAARAFWERHDDVRTRGALRARAAAPPAALAEVVRSVLRPLLGTLRNGAAVLYPTLGLAFASGDPGEAGPTAAALGGARAALGPLGGSLVLCAAPAEIRARAGAWGAPPASIAVMRRVKDELDPDHRLAPGRFVGGI